MDVHCSSCGEPWDTYHLSHDAVHETDMTEAEVTEWKRLPSPHRLLSAYREAFLAAGYEFGKSMLNVKRCPCCPPGATPDPDKVHLKAELEQMLGDDADGLAAHLEDLHL